MNTSVTPAPGLVKTLRWSAVATAALALVQGVLGGITIGSDGLATIHGVVGMVTFVPAVLCAAAAFKFANLPGNEEHRGLMMHAIGIALMAVVQIGLGEMGVRGLHIGLGVGILLGAFALADLAIRRTAPAAQH